MASNLTAQRLNLNLGKVVSFAGDNEGQHEWGGFKVGVGFAFQKCRYCHCTFYAMQNKFLEDDSILQTKVTYSQATVHRN